MPIYNYPLELVTSILVLVTHGSFRQLTVVSRSTLVMHRVSFFHFAISEGFIISALLIGLTQEVYIDSD